LNTKKIIYSILKELDWGNINISHEDYDLSLEEFGIILCQMKDEGLVRNLYVSWADDTVDEVYLENARVSLAGYDFIEKNSPWGKIYKGIKEIARFLK
jgi:hypothetical protein